MGMNELGLRAFETKRNETKRNEMGFYEIMRMTFQNDSRLSFPEEIDGGFLYRLSRTRIS